jgi:hypothetical protein
MKHRPAAKDDPLYKIVPRSNGFQVLDRQQKSHGTYGSQDAAQKHLDELLGITPAPPPQDEATHESATRAPAS